MSAASPTDVVGLQFATRTKTLGIPLAILLAVVGISVIISVAILRAGGSIAGTHYNEGIVWSLIGFLVTLGVQNVTASFPFALGLGSTRRAFVLGNLLTCAAIAAYIAAATLLLLGIEVLTGGWFMGAHVLRVDAFGGGDPARVLLTMFLGALAATSVGSLFGAAYIRLGAMGPVLLGLAVALLAAIGLLLFLPQLPAVVAAFEPWWLAIAAVAVVAIAAVGQVALLRRASVR